MPIITLPDGKTLSFPAPVSGRKIAETISPGLAKRSLAVKIGTELFDLDRPIANDCAVVLVTAANDNPDALHVLRHSCAHVMAEAICGLWPKTRGDLDHYMAQAWRQCHESGPIYFSAPANYGAAYGTCGDNDNRECTISGITFERDGKRSLRIGGRAMA